MKLTHVQYFSCWHFEPQLTPISADVYIWFNDLIPPRIWHYTTANDRNQTNMAKWTPVIHSTLTGGHFVSASQQNEAVDNIVRSTCTPSTDFMQLWNPGLNSLSARTFYRKSSWSLEAGRFGFRLVQSLCNLTDTSATALPICLSHFRAIRLLKHPIPLPQGFTRFGGTTFYRLLNRGPGASWMIDNCSYN